MFKNFEIYEGFLNIEEKVDKKWIKKTLEKDEKFLEILQVASDEKRNKEIIDLGISISKKFKNIIIVGIGGSTLAIKAMLEMKKYENSRNEIFVIDNLSPSYLDFVLKTINIKDSFFVFISKSGGTIETSSQMVVILDYLTDYGLLKNEISEICLTITSGNDSDMAKISKNFNIEILPWSGNVSGRFSAFSNNITLISSICGFNAKNNLAIFKKYTQKLISDDAFLKRLNFTICSIEKKISSTVLFCYDEKLRYLTDWYIQAWAESIGKNGIGTNPCGAIGPIDQHSKLQLYLGGPKDKIFTIINPVFKQKTTITSNQIKDLHMIEIEKIINSAAKASLLSLLDQNIPCNFIECEIDESFIAKMMTFFTLEVILACHYFSLNPYDQPEVEASKIHMKNALKK